MNFYKNAISISPDVAIRAHPLILSLTEAFNASEANPNISTVSENDERVLRSKFYISPIAFPPLEMHFLGQIGPYILLIEPPIKIAIFSLSLIPVAGCQECMSGGIASQGNSAAMNPTSKSNLTNIGRVSLSPRNKGTQKKRRRASSGGSLGNLPNARGPKTAGVIRRPKENLARKAGSPDASSSSSEGWSDRSSQESRNQDTEPRMFSGVIAQHFDVLTKGIDDDAVVIGLKNAVQDLKSRCDMLEKTIRNLQSICGTHENSLETFRQYVINHGLHQGALDFSYEGETFEVTMPVS
jgi:hypothetical protein